MKYIITDSEFQPAIVIGHDVGHQDLKKSVPHSRIAGAGHFEIIDGKVQVYGKSIGLGIGPSERDASLLAAHLGLGYDHVLPDRETL